MKIIKIIMMTFMVLMWSHVALGAQQSTASDSVDTTISKNGAFVSKSLEGRATRLFRNIKCPICVAQSVAESDAEISKTLRDHIRREIVSGKTDQQILDEITLRYGNEVLLNPKVGASTLLLWLAPWIFLIFGFYVWRRMHHAKNEKIHP